MKKLLMISALLILAAQAYAAFENVGETARAKAMGNAIFGDFDGVNTMNYNPATIGSTHSIQGYGSWGTPYTGFNDGSSINKFDLNIVLPFWYDFKIPGDEFVTKDAALGFQVYRLSSGGLDSDGVTPVEFYHEGIYSLIYSRNLDNVLFQGALISTGVKFSLYDIGVGETIDSTSNPYLGGAQTRLSFGMDLGVTYNFSRDIRIGLVYKNLVAPNISILADGTDTLPSEITLGANWMLGDLFGFLKKSNLGFGVVMYGRDSTDNRQSDNSINIGYEFGQLTPKDLFNDTYNTNEMLKVRMGFQYLSKKVGDDVDFGLFKLKGVFTVTGGIGFNYVIAREHKISLDYATEWIMTGGALKHTVGLSYSYLLKDEYDFEYNKEMHDSKMKEYQDKKASEDAANAAKAGEKSPTPAPTPKPTPKPTKKPR